MRSGAGPRAQADGRRDGHGHGCGRGLRRRRGGGREGHARNAAPQRAMGPAAPRSARPRSCPPTSSSRSTPARSACSRRSGWTSSTRMRARSCAAGATVDPDSHRVRFDPEMVTELIGTAPASSLHARPAHDVELGGDWIAFGTVGSPPNVADLDRGRRIGNREDYQNLLQLAQSLNAVHFLSGYPVEPVDVHHGVRHLHASYDALTLMDKAIHCYSLGASGTSMSSRWCGSRAASTGDHRPRAVGLHRRQLQLAAAPRRADAAGDHGSRTQPGRVHHAVHAGRRDGAGDARRRARRAERRGAAGMVLTQVVRPGAPVIYGGFTSNVDMQSGAPAFGTPEYMRTAMIGGQLARRYGVPYRSSNVNAANALDAQAAYESVFSLWGAIMGGVNLLMHGAGWMEGGLHASYEKMILDAELLGMVEAFLGRSSSTRTPRVRRRSRRSARAAISSAPSTRSRATRPRSTSRCSATGGTTRRGRRPAPRSCRPRRTGSGRSCSPRTSRRRWAIRADASSRGARRGVDDSARVAEGGRPPRIG